MELLSPPSGRKSNYILTLTLSACSWHHRFLSTFIYLYTTVKPPWALASQSLLLDVKWLPKVTTNSRCQKIVSCELQSDSSWDGRGSSLFENMRNWHLSFFSRWPRTFIASLQTTITLFAVARSVWRAKVRCSHTSWRGADRAAWRLRASSSPATPSGVQVRSPTAVCALGSAPPPPWPPMPPSEPQVWAWQNRPPPPAPPGTYRLSPW